MSKIESYKNTAIIDLDRYDELIDKENLLDDFLSEHNIIYESSRNNYGLKEVTKFYSLSKDEAIKKLKEELKNINEKNNKILRDYNDVKFKNEELLKLNNGHHSDLRELKNMSIKEFKKWRRKE